jgi:hypothetical protein
MSFSSSVTPETRNRKNAITAGEMAVHNGAPQAALTSHNPHQTQKSPK